MNEQIYGWIYGLQSPKGKWYIGQTTSQDPYEYIKKEYKTQLGSRRRKMRFALLKYGFENFKVTIISEAYSKESLDELEISYIKVYNSVEFGYNCQYGGSKGKHSLESKRLMSASRIGKKQKQETIEKRVKSLIGQTRSQEQKKKISDSLKGKKRPQISGSNNPFAKLHKVRRLCDGYEEEGCLAVMAKKYGFSDSCIHKNRQSCGWELLTKKHPKALIDPKETSIKKSLANINFYKAHKDIRKNYIYTFIIKGTQVSHFSLEQISKENNVSIHILRHLVTKVNYKSREIDIKFISKTRKES